MPETMIALRKTKRARGAEIQEIPIPDVKPNEVLIKVQASSLCGTDVHIYEWDNWAQSRVKNVPYTVGHETTGVVVKKGSVVSRVEEGDVVSVETHLPCGHCKQCMTGQMHICHNLKILGVDTNGAFAEYLVVPEVVLWKNDTSIPPEFLSIQEPLGNAVHAIYVYSLPPGPIWLLHTFYLVSTAFMLAWYLRYGLRQHAHSGTGRMGESPDAAGTRRCLTSPHPR